MLGIVSRIPIGDVRPGMIIVTPFGDFIAKVDSTMPFTHDGKVFVRTPINDLGMGIL